MQLHQLTDSPLVWPTFQGHRGQNVKIKRSVNQGSTTTETCNLADYRAETLV